MDDIGSSKKNHPPVSSKVGLDVPRKGSVSSGNTVATEDMSSVDGSSNASTPSQRRRPSLKMTAAGNKSKGSKPSPPNAPLSDANHDSFRCVEDSHEWWDQVDSPTAAKQEIEEPLLGGKEKKHHKKKKRIAVVKKVKASDLSAEALDKIRVKGRGSMDGQDLEKALEAFKADQALDNRSRRSSTPGADVCHNSTADTGRGRARETRRSSMPGEARRSKSRARSEAGAPDNPAAEQRRGRSRSVARTRETEEKISRDKSRTRKAAAEEEGERRSKSVGRGGRSKSVGRRREGKDTSSGHPRQVLVPQFHARAPSGGSGEDASRHQRSKSVGRGCMSSFGKKVAPEEPAVPLKVVTPVPAVKDDTGARRQRSKSVGRGSLTHRSNPSGEESASRDRGQDRGRSARPVEGESDRPRARSIGRGVVASPKDSGTPGRVKKKVRSKSIGRSLSGKSSGPADIPPPKRWDEGRQRSKSIGPRRNAPETEEDEFTKMAHSSLSRGSFFNQSMDDSDGEEEENNRSRRSAVPLVVQNIANKSTVMCDDTETDCNQSQFSAKESASAKSIPWDTFLHKAEAEMSQKTR